MTLAVGIGFVCFDLVDNVEGYRQYAITWPLSAVARHLYDMLQDPLKIALEISLYSTSNHNTLMEYRS